MISHSPSLRENALRLSIRRRTLVFILTVLTVITGPFALLMTQAQITSSEPSTPTTSETSAPSTNERDEDIFVIYRNELGESVCREANFEEKRRILGRDVSGSTHIIYSGGRRPGIDNNKIGTALMTATGAALLPSAGLRIVLHGTEQLQNNPTARDAFIVAANRWEALVSTPMTVVIDVDFGTTFFGDPFDSANILGATASSIQHSIPSTVRQQLINNASGAEELQLYNALPETSIPVELNNTTTSASSVRLTWTVARALGLRSDITNPDSIPLGQGDAGIGFNSAHPFDFNPNDGITPGTLDFDAVVVHEIGHALGFTSESGDGVASPVSMWDLFRFRPGTASLSTFGTASRVMSEGGNQVFFNNRTNTFGSRELELSTGGSDGEGGDGEQSSHWKDDRFTAFIGIMDPALRTGLREVITQNDLNALDAFGYRIVGAAPTPTPTPTPTPSVSFFEFSHASYSVFENEGSAGIVIVRSGDVSTQQTIHFMAQSSPGVLPGPGTNQDLTFAPGETYKVTNGVGITNDLQPDPNLIANLSLQPLSPGTMIGAQSTAILTIFDDDSFPANSVQFQGSPLQFVSEDAGKIELTVTRTALSGGDLSQDAFVSYRTFNSTALDTRDYSLAGGTLHFLPGESSKNVTILITDDAFDESDETFTVQLMKPLRTNVFELQNTIVTVQIQDNDPAGVMTNPSDVSSSFVTQHYMDFLNRVPDSNGLNFWTQEIEQCGADAQCREAKRVNVSAAFFHAIEFQETGFLVYRLYKAAYGNFVNAPVPAMHLQDFMSDSQEIGRGIVVGTPGWPELLEARKQAFVGDFVKRGRFKTALPPELTPAQFVDRLNNNIGQLLTQSQREQLVAQLTANNNDAGRASVLRTIAEHQSLRNAEFRKAFVLMQYFGYLRRNPNDGPDFNYNGYNFWLDKLNQHNGNFVTAEMVKAFILSIEYRQRFGS